MSFNSFNLHPHIMAGVEALGYKVPTPIQQESIPSIMLGRDMMGLAQTGTGKTAAFVLPILHKLMEGPRGQARAIIIAPTRELAQQIHETIHSLAKSTPLRSVALYGGINIQSQIQKLRRGAEIIVACPGRLLDHVRQNTVNLGRIEVLVLDEADQMFDMGFLPCIRKILAQLPAKKQSLLFSATMPNEIQELTQIVLRNPVTVKLSPTKPAASVKQVIYPVAEHLKGELIVKILETTDTESVLIFTRTKHGAKSLARRLEVAGFSSAALQGNLSQSQRQRVMQAFRSGKLQILVATDIASRGIDIAQISHVINYDIPTTVEAYTHRIGRTGRAAKTGDAITLVTQAEMFRVRNIERALGSKLEQCMMPGFDYKTSRPKQAHQHHSSDRPRTSGDRPRAAGDRPRAAGDRPRAAGDRPRAAGDRPRTSGDRPRTAGDRPRASDDRPRTAASANRNRSSSGQGQGQSQGQGQRDRARARRRD